MEMLLSKAGQLFTTMNTETKTYSVCFGTKKIMQSKEDLQIWHLDKKGLYFIVELQSKNLYVCSVLDKEPTLVGQNVEHKIHTAFFLKEGNLHKVYQDGNAYRAREIFKNVSRFSDNGIYLQVVVGNTLFVYEENSRDEYIPRKSVTNCNVTANRLLLACGVLVFDDYLYKNGYSIKFDSIEFFGAHSRYAIIDNQMLVSLNEGNMQVKIDLRANRKQRISYVSQKTFYVTRPSNEGGHYFLHL